MNVLGMSTFCMYGLVCVFVCKTCLALYNWIWGGWVLFVRMSLLMDAPHKTSTIRDHSSSCLPLLTITIHHILFTNSRPYSFPPSFTLLALVDSGVTENFMLPHVVSFLSWLRRRLAVFNNKSHDRYKATGNGGAVEQMAFHFEPTHIYIL